jgi:uncharacterized protein
MHFEWDEKKNLCNIEKHGLDFNDAKKLFEAPILKFEDNRRDYGEVRTVGFGILHGKIMNIVYTERSQVIRIISFRRANSREEELYEKSIKNKLG